MSDAMKGVWTIVLIVLVGAAFYFALWANEWSQGVFYLVIAHALRNEIFRHVDHG